MSEEHIRDAWRIGPYEITWLSKLRVWIRKEGGEGMETDQLKLAHALVEALNAFWKKEF